MTGDSDDSETASMQCEYGDCPREALVFLTTEVKGTATANHYLCDEHAEKVRNSPVNGAEVIYEEELT